ncbi:hypothetical protein [Desulfosporosinus sp. FKA]|uniref:hypothetical protein n=1 Tax=Desulfosporosinus sp. FKA TaxID=1969834 RepID=UPI000B49CF86|nr:hypothetical protein [Desulfosporosinus sp. FKA]
MARSPINNLKENEGIAALIFLILCTLLAFKISPGVGTSNLAPAVPHATAPWIFGPFQVLLLYLPPWLGALAVPALIIIGLAGVPWAAHYWGDKWGRRIFNVLFSLVLILLFWFMVKELWWTRL